MSRKKIFTCITGSNLYGTNRPESDLDKGGVFMPSRQDLLSLQNCPSTFKESTKISAGPRNSAGDIDCTYFSLKSFLDLASEGQPGQLEMLFVPDSMALEKTKEWDDILDHSHLFISKKGIWPFVGFARAQAHKSKIKGENLNHIRDLVAWGSSLEESSLREPISSFLDVVEPGSGKLHIKGTIIEVGVVKNDFGAIMLDIAGKKYDIGLKTKTLLTNLEKLVNEYGTRSQNAAARGYDFKSLGHAYRLLFEAEEFLKRGFITLPRPRPEVEFLKSVLAGNCDPNFDFLEDLTTMIDHLQQKILPHSNLPDKPDLSKINDLCEEMLWTHLRKTGSKKIWTFVRKLFT